MQLRNIIKNLWPIGKCSKLENEHLYIKDKAIYGVYHVFCVNAWKNLVVEQLQAIQKSGLIDITDHLFVSCIYCNVDEKKELENILSSFSISFEIISALSLSNNQFEFPALEFIHQLSMKENFYVYYFHTKGVSYTKEKAESYPSKNMKDLNRCSTAWRKMMEYFIFTRYNTALNALREYDAYGCKYDDPIVPPYHYRYYAGNFWWSKSSYIRTLPGFSEEQKKNRYWAENWLLLKADKIFSAFNTPAELYAVAIPKCVYTRQIMGG